MPGLLKRWRYSLEAMLVRTAVALVPRLPRRSALTLARWLGLAAYVVDYRGRRTGRENLRLVFPEKDDQWREAVLQRSYQSFATTMIDLFWGPNLTPQTWQTWTRLEYLDPVHGPHDADRGAIWCCPHFGRFEWIGRVMPFRGYPMMAVAQDFKNPALTEIFTRLRSHHDQIIISSQGAMLRLYKNLKRGGHSAFLSDLTVKPTQAATVIRCFGRKMSVGVIHASLAKRTGHPVIPMVAIPHPDGTCTLRQWPAQYFPPDATPQHIAQHIWDLFEPVIREQPEHWLWMYKHWRYLPADTEGQTYPSYANRSKKFDALEAAELNLAALPSLQAAL